MNPLKWFRPRQPLDGNKDTPTPPSPKITRALEDVFTRLSRAEPDTSALEALAKHTLRTPGDVQKAVALTIRNIIPQRLLAQLISGYLGAHGNSTEASTVVLTTLTEQATYSSVRYLWQAILPLIPKEHRSDFALQLLTSTPDSEGDAKALIEGLPDTMKRPVLLRLAIHGSRHYSERAAFDLARTPMTLPEAREAVTEILKAKPEEDDAGVLKIWRAISPHIETIAKDGDLLTQAKGVAQTITQQSSSVAGAAAMQVLGNSEDSEREKYLTLLYSNAPRRYQAVAGAFLARVVIPERAAKLIDEALQVGGQVSEALAEKVFTYGTDKQRDSLFERALVEHETNPNYHDDTLHLALSKLSRNSEIRAAMAHCLRRSARDSFPVDLTLPELGFTGLALLTHFCDETATPTHLVPTALKGYFHDAVRMGVTFCRLAEDINFVYVKLPDEWTVRRIGGTVLYMDEYNLPAARAGLLDKGSKHLRFEVALYPPELRKLPAPATESFTELPPGTKLLDAAYFSGLGRKRAPVAIYNTETGKSAYALIRSKDGRLVAATDRGGRIVLTADNLGSTYQLRSLTADELRPISEREAALEALQRRWLTEAKASAGSTRVSDGSDLVLEMTHSAGPNLALEKEEQRLDEERREQERKKALKAMEDEQIALWKRLHQELIHRLAHELTRKPEIDLEQDY